MKYSNFVDRYAATAINSGIQVFRLSVLWTLSTSMVIMAGCGSSENPTFDPSVVANIELSPDDEPFISKGQELQLLASATNALGDEVTGALLIWTSSDPAVADVTNAGLITGVSGGTATVTVEAGNASQSLTFRVVDLTGTWVGGVDPDNVTYTLVQTGTSVDGNFESSLGFPPITDVNTGVLTGSLEFGTYEHILELTTEEGCVLRIAGNHEVELEGDELILTPGPGGLSSTNCSIFGTIDFATLRRE